MNDSIYFVLNKNIDANKLLKSIEELIKKSNINQDGLLKIQIINIAYDKSIIQNIELKC